MGSLPQLAALGSLISTMGRSGVTLDRWGHLVRRSGPTFHTARAAPPIAQEPNWSWAGGAGGRQEAKQMLQTAQLHQHQTLEPLRTNGFFTRWPSTRQETGVGDCCHRRMQRALGDESTSTKHQERGPYLSVCSALRRSMVSEGMRIRELSSQAWCQEALPLASFQPSAGCKRRAPPHR